MGPNEPEIYPLLYDYGTSAYRPDEGEILLNDQLINDWPPTSAHSGLFLALQYPVAIPGDRGKFSADRIKYSPKKQEPG
jgi:Fe-S cluster assembly ATPase SufC